MTYADANFNSSTLAAANITLNETGTAAGSISSVTGSGLTRTVTISGITGNGTLGISVAAGTASDLAGNLAPAAGPSGTFIVDNTAPTISIGAPSASYAAGGPVTYTVTYADANFNSSTLAAANITLNKTGTAAGSISSVTGSGLTRTVTISGITGNGTLGISIAAGTASDLAGNLAPAAGPSGTFIVDNTAPTISIGVPSASYAAGGPVTYTVTYADANFNTSTLAAANITLNETGTAAGSISSVTGSGLTRTVTISGITGNGTLGISIAAGTASDLAGNLAPASGPSGTFIVDNTAPTISIGTPSASYAAGGPIIYTVTYADANFNSSNLAAANITLNETGTAAGSISSVTGSGLTRTVTISGITGNGTLGISIAAGTASDLAGNLAPAAGPSGTFIVDNTAPTISIGAPSASYAAGGPVTYTVTYADANFNSSTLAAANITLNKTGSAAGSISSVTGSGLTRTVTISGITGNGTLGISVAAGTASDLAGNLAPAAGPSGTFIVDNTAPTISIGTPSAAYAAGGPVTYTVTYADANFNSSTLAAANITLNETGTAAGSISSVTGSGLTRTVTISGITGNGTLGISIAAGTASDLAGNLAPASGPSGTFIVDNTAPTISIGTPSASYAAGGPIIYTVTYADANFNTSTLAAANITLNETGTAAGSISSVTGSGLTRTVTISGITGNGTLGISIAAGTASDLAGNLAPAAGPSGTFIVDNTAPTISIGTPSASYAAGGPIIYTVTYADANFNTSTLVAANITLNETGTAAGSISSVTGSGLTRTVTISGITGNGTLGISIAAGTASDLAGNLAPASGPSGTFIVDNTAPTISIGTPSASYAAGGPVTYTVTYADANFNTSTLAAANITLNETGTAAGSISSVSGSGLTRTVTISGITGNGTLGISIAAGTASDLAGNLAPASGPSGTFIVDNTAPTISIGAPSASYAAGGPVTYTVTYADANFNSSTLAAANITLNETGTAAGSISSVTGSGLTRTVTISGITGNGTLGISVAAGTASDLAGNPAPAAGPSGTFIVDNTAPTISIGAPSAAYAAGGPVTYTVTYADANFSSSSLALANISLDPTGTANGTIAVSGSGLTYTVTVSNITGNGSLGISIAAGTATDKAGNTAPAATSATFIVDNTAPTISIGAPSASYVAGGPVTYTVTYADANFSSSSLALGSISLDPTGTANGTVAVSGSGLTYTVTVSNITGNGSLGISIAAGTATDKAGNTAPAATSATFIVDNTAPTISIGAPSASYAAGGPVTYTVTYADANFSSSSLALGSISLDPTGTANGTVAVSGSGLTYTVTVSNITGNGSLGISIAAGTASDLAGNLAPAAGPSGTFIVDNTAPTISIGAPSASYAAGGPVTYTVTYADANFNSSTLAAANITLNKTGSAAGSISSVSGTGLTRTVTISGITGNGTLGISIAAGTASDLAGNLAPAAGPSGTFIVDNTAPTISIGAPSASYAAGGPVTYTVTYADANFNASTLAAANITLNETGTAAGSISSVSGSGLTRTVTISGITGNGTLGISIAAGTASDLAGNLAPAAGPSGTFIVDNTAPTISIGSPSAAYAAGGPVTYTVTYADANFNASTLAAANITLNETGTAAGSISSVSGSGLTRTVTISGITGNGTLGISIAAGTASDLAGNLAPAAGPSGTFIVDNTAPTISIGTPSAAYAAGGPVTYTVTYADANFNTSTLAAANITLNETGTAAGSISSVSGSGLTRTVTISGITGNGTLGISIAAGTASDLAGNLAPAAGPSGTFIVDNTAPTISIGAPSASYAAGGPVTYTVTYADANFNSSTLAAANITLNETGTAAGSISSVTGSGLTRTVTISGITGNGSLGISIAAGTATDKAGNTAPAATSATFIVDNTAPTISIGAPSASYVAGGPVTYTVTYADANFSSSSLALGSISLDPTGTANGTIAVNGSGLTYTVTVSNITGDGSLGISIAAGTASDLAGNPAPAATSATFIVDNTAPTISIGAPSAAYVAGGPVTYTVTYADANFSSSNLALANISLDPTGTANGTVAVSGSGLTYTVTVSNITGNGSLGISIAAGTATDKAGNTAPAATSATFIVDNTAPTISIGAPSASYVAGGPVTYTVTYADANFSSSSLALGSISLDPTGTANGTVAVSGSGLTYTVTVSNITGNGSLGISIAAGTATDKAGNTAPAAGPSGTFIVDNTAPTISIGAPSAAYVAGGPVTYTVTYADANFSSSNLALANISLDPTGTANGTVAVNGSGLTYTVTVSNITGNGSLGISIAAGTATDKAGNTAPAATSATFIVDNTAPTISIGAPSASYVAGGPVTYTVTYADANFSSSNLALANISLDPTGTANGTVAVSGSGLTYTVTVSNITGNGSLGISIAAGTASDKAGNTAPAATSATFIVDNTAPTISIGAPSAAYVAGGPVTYTVTYADANFSSSSLALGSISLDPTGTANGTVAVNGSGLTYTVTVSNITGNGSLGISIAAGTATDKVGNTAPAATSATFIVDNTAPTISIGAPSAAYVAGGPVTYTVTYADANFSSSDLALANISLDPTGTANGTVAVSGSGLTYTVTVSNITGDGSLGISIAAGTASDLAGNLAPAAGPSGTFIVDNTAPTVSIGAPSASYVAGGPVTYTVTYADANFSSSNLALGSISLDPTGTANGTVAVSGSGLTYTVTISGITGDGALGISIAAGTASDLAGNTAPAATSATFIVDNTVPTISIGAPSASYVAGGPVTYTVTYADANFSSSSLALANISLDPTGTANGTIAVTGSGLTYTVTISDITGDGSLGISIAAGTASDLAGNLAPAAGPSATFTVDNTGPTVATPASATINPVTGTTTGLSVLGADIATGEGSLTYSWAAATLPTGAAAPIFSVNGSNAAKSTTATFSMAGTYDLTVTITDSAGLSTTSSVSVTVNQTLTTVSLAGLPLTPTAFDQFGNPLANQPDIDAGSDTITGPLLLDNNVTVLPVAGSPLTISGGISGAGGLTVGGAPGTPGQGTVILAGQNGYTGGTIVSAGTLVVGNSSAIATGTNLTVGAGASFLFDQSSGVPSPAIVAATTRVPASSVGTTTVSNAATAAISTVTSARTGAPVTTNAVLQDLESPAPTAASVVKHVPPGRNSRLPIVWPAALQAQQSVAAGALDTSAGDRLVGPSTAKRIAGDLAWLRQAAYSPDNSDQHRKKEAAILALEAVFAQYGG